MGIKNSEKWCVEKNKQKVYEERNDWKMEGKNDQKILRENQQIKNKYFGYNK